MTDYSTAVNDSVVPIKPENINKLINSQYKIWHKNIPFIYDYCLVHALEWPSLTCEWLPHITVHDDYITQRMLLGTHTSENEQNNILLVDVKLPRLDKDTDIRQFDTKTNTLGGTNNLVSNVSIIQSIGHDGEVNRARAMPIDNTVDINKLQSTDPNQQCIVASKGDSADVLIYDLNKQPSKSNRIANNQPDLRLTGHEKEGFGLAWNTIHKTQLVSGSDDKLVCVWDIQGNVQNHSIQHSAQSIDTTINNTDDTSNNNQSHTNTIAPLSTYRGHTGVIEDVQWNPHSPCQFMSAGEDGLLILWDTRQPDKYVHRIQAHHGEVNSVAFNPIYDTLFASGSGDNTVCLWDIRNPTLSLHTMTQHDDSVLSVSWAPVEWKQSNGNVLASCSSDRRVHVYDVSLIGSNATQTNDIDLVDGPPELLFIHAGHTDKVADLTLNPLQPWQFASVADDNILQVWTIATSVINQIYQ